MAGTYEQLAASPCPGWVGRLPPRAGALLLLGTRLQRAGGLGETFGAVLSQRLEQLPAVPD